LALAFSLSAASCTNLHRDERNPALNPAPILGVSDPLLLQRE
jgi:hypothetical protein